LDPSFLLFNMPWNKISLTHFSLLLLDSFFQDLRVRPPQPATAHEDEELTLYEYSCKLGMWEGRENRIRERGEKELAGRGLKG
jgi:hypothetical protein